MVAPIAQLDRAADYGSAGYRFNSYWVHQPSPRLVVFSLLDGFGRSRFRIVVGRNFVAETDDDG
jgi:hypothetical protein